MRETTVRGPRRRRVGIMGGTFDPIHIGHLILAECAYEQFHLDTVQFLPSGNPPHKTDRRDGASDEERLAMVALAIRDNPHFTLDAEEMRRTGYSYTSDTLVALRERNPDTDYYFIVGADSLMSLDTWRAPDVISRNCVLLAAVRDQFSIAEMEEQAARLHERYGAQIRFLRSPELDISSTDLRARCRDGRSLRYYIPDDVIAYIRQSGIYGGEDAVSIQRERHDQSKDVTAK